MNSKAMMAAGATMLLAGTFAVGVAAGGAAEAASATTVTIRYLAEAPRGVPSPCGQVTGGGSAKVQKTTPTQTPEIVTCQATFRVLR